MKDKQHNIVTPLVAGGAAALFQTTVSYPFEFLKTGMQLHRSYPGVPPFNMMHQLKVYFAGCSAVNIGILLKTFGRFGIFDACSNLLKDPNASASAALSGPRLLLAGSLTGFAESLIIIPFENIKTTMVENALLQSERLQSAEKAKSTVTSSPETLQPAGKRTFHKPVKQELPRRYTEFLKYEKHPSVGMFNTIKEIYSTRGFHGFIQGAVPTMIRQVGNSVVRFTTYTTLRQTILPNQQVNEYHATLLGVASSCAVVAFTQPIDVIKTRMQSKYSWKYNRNALNCAYRIFVEEGIGNFWKGWAPRLAKVGISGGVSFGIYQYVENLMNTMKYEGYFGA